MHRDLGALDEKRHPLGLQALAFLRQYHTFGDRENCHRIDVEVDGMLGVEKLVQEAEPGREVAMTELDVERSLRLPAVAAEV